MTLHARRVAVLEDKCKALELEKESILAANIQVSTLAHSFSLSIINTFFACKTGSGDFALRSYESSGDDHDLSRGRRLLEDAGERLLRLTFYYIHT